MQMSNLDAFEEAAGDCVPQTPSGVAAVFNSCIIGKNISESISINLSTTVESALLHMSSHEYNWNHQTSDT